MPFRTPSGSRPPSGSRAWPLRLRGWSPWNCRCSLVGLAERWPAGTILTAGSRSNAVHPCGCPGCRTGPGTRPAPWHTNRLAVTALGDGLACRDRRLRQDRCRRAVPEPPRSRRTWRTVGCRTRGFLGHAAEAEPRAVRLDPRRCIAGPRLAAATAPRRRQPSTTSARMVPGTSNGRPCASCSRWPWAQPDTSANSRRASESSPMPCAGTSTSQDRCSSAKGWWPPSPRSGRCAAESRSCRPSSTKPSRRPPPNRPALTASCCVKPSRRPAFPSSAGRTAGPRELPGRGPGNHRPILASFPDFVPLPREGSLPWLSRLKAVLLSPQRELGEKPLLVVGPSLGTSTVLWTETAALLGDEYDVIGWDLPGHGISPTSHRRFRCCGTGGRRRRSCRLRCRGENFHYAGVSLGGATGLQLGIKHGDRLPQPVRPVQRRQARHARRLAGARRNRPDPGHPRDDPGLRGTLVCARIHGPPAGDQQPPPARPARRRPLRLRVLLRSPRRV